MTKNQFVAEKLGLFLEGVFNKPDFSTDAGAVALLRLMMARVDWRRFIVRKLISYSGSISRSA